MVEDSRLQRHRHSKHATRSRKLGDLVNWGGMRPDDLSKVMWDCVVAVFVVSAGICDRRNENTPLLTQEWCRLRWKVTESLACFSHSDIANDGKFCYWRMMTREVSQMRSWLALGCYIFLYRPLCGHGLNPTWSGRRGLVPSKTCSIR